MAVVFVHGVNVRRSAEYDTSVATRDEMIRQHLLKPLLLLSHDIMNPYWGDCGVSFAWNQDTVPQVSEKVTTHPMKRVGFG
ncbi:MAG: hypothetical protein NT023_14010 [Armatimonadetes bacterium]|nr:hypothetical protein [Armatimonadota bacterium]